jgi:hypothetical protein
VHLLLAGGAIPATSASARSPPSRPHRLRQVSEAHQPPDPAARLVSATPTTIVVVHTTAMAAVQSNRARQFMMRGPARVSELGLRDMGRDHRYTLTCSPMYNCDQMRFIAGTVTRTQP